MLFIIRLVLLHTAVRRGGNNHEISRNHAKKIRHPKAEHSAACCHVVDFRRLFSFVTSINSLVFAALYLFVHLGYEQITRQMQPLLF